MKEEIFNLIKKDCINLEKIHRITGYDYDVIIGILDELKKDGLIFLNTSKKYEVMSSDYMIGVVEKTTKGDCYVVCNGEKIYISSDELHTALKYDTVVVETKFDNHGSIKGIINRKNNRLVCEVKEWNNKLILVPFNGNCEINLIVSDDKLLKDYIVGDRVYVSLTNESSDENDVIVRDVHKIGHFNDAFNDELAIAISKDFDIEFSEEAMREAEAIPQTVQEDEKVGRLDLTDEVVFTIDSVHTKDMDDAISIKRLPNGNYQLGVHIADVSHYVKPGTALFEEARKRATSVYIGDVVIPMIPSILSNGICSLNEGVERLTKSCIMEITPQGKVVNHELRDSVIKSKKKMTYEDLNRMFNGEEVDSSYSEFDEDLQQMRSLSRILSKIKNNIEFESSDISVKKDVFNGDKTLGFERRDQNEAEKLIENFMIIANETVATEFYWRNLPFMYRTHDCPEELKLEDTIDQIKELGLGKKLIKIQNAYGPGALKSILDHYKDSPLYSVVSNLLLRSMAKAQYATENIGHFALGLDAYCHFTSPIRRFPDLMVHTLINMFNNDEFDYNNLDKLHDELTQMAIHSSYKERQADDAEKDFIKLRMAEYMAEHQDEDFEGMILDVDKENVYIKLDNNVKCLLDRAGDFAYAFDIDNCKKHLVSKHGKQKIKLGTRVSTKVTGVDLPQKQVYVDVKEILKEDSKQYVKKLESK